ncbi:MAG: heme-copper oxidase subunit III [Chitinophagales bacterium]
MNSNNPTPSSRNGYEDPPFTKIHPLLMMLYFGIASLTVLFLGLTVAYFLSKESWTWSQFRFPRVFLLSTVVIVASSFSIQRALKHYQTDASEQLQKTLLLSLVLSVLFIVLQVIGWGDLYARGIYIAGKPDGSYLYLISGLHVLHVLAGLLVLFVFYKKVNKKLKDPVESLLFFTTPKKERQLQMIVTYWHFVDVLWVYLLLFFLFNHL